MNHFELIDGRGIQKPLPKNLHAFIQTYLSFYFRANLPAFLRAGSELNVLCGNDRMIPDITVMRRDAQFRDGDLADPPLLVIEILSPGQLVGDLFSKADRLLQAGTRTCWIIWPENRSAWIYSLSGLSEAKETLTADLIDDHGVTASFIQIPTSQMWAELDD